MTRVYGNSAAAVRQFAIYWHIIHPGSDIIRRTWLRAIKRRAESSTTEITKDTKENKDSFSVNFACFVVDCYA